MVRKDEERVKGRDKGEMDDRGGRGIGGGGRKSEGREEERKNEERKRSEEGEKGMSRGY